MTGMARFVQHSHSNHPPHRFEVYDLALADQALIDDLAADVRALYLDDDFGAVLEQAARDLDMVTDSDAVAELVTSAARSAIPEPAQRTTQPWLDTARNELGEVICYSALEELHGASVLAKRVRHKEIPHLPTRGMDAVALGDDATAPSGLRIYLSETKSSASADSPPSVVDQADDCLHTQLLTAVQGRTKVAAELARAAKYLSGAEQQRLARAMLLWGTGQLATTVVPFLLRPQDRHGTHDFGAFHDAPTAFDPAHVAFCLVRIAGSIEALSKAVYEKARE